MNDKIKNAFSQVKADDNLKEMTFEKITMKKKKKTINVFYKLAPVMAVVAIVFLFNVYFTPTSYISIDINPSIEMEVNTFDRIIKVYANNEDAQEIVNSINLQNLTYVEGLEKLSNSQSFLEYETSYTEVTVVSNSKENSEEIIENISNCEFGENENVECFSESKEIKEEASSYDISFGKYRAYLELLEVDPTVEIEDIKDLSMNEIRYMIENDGNSIDDNQGGSGNGDGNGSSQGENGNGDGNGSNQGENGNGDGNGSSQEENGNGDGNGSNQGENGNGDGNGNNQGENGNVDGNGSSQGENGNGDGNGNNQGENGNGSNQGGNGSN